MEIAEFPRKKRKLGPGNGGDGKGEKEEGGKDYFYPFKFAVIKRDLRSIIGDKRDFYNIFSIRFNLLERWADEIII